MLISTADAVMVDLFDLLDLMLRKVILYEESSTEYSYLNWTNLGRSCSRLDLEYRNLVESEISGIINLFLNNI
jgi:hypothetical protein